MSVAVNPWALLRRQEKATKLAAVLRENRVTAANVRELLERNNKPAEEFWALCAQKAGCHPPSLTTKKLVADLLERGY